MKFLRLFLIVLGFASLALGLIGIFLPLLPATPFILLSAYCFSKSSDRFNNQLRNHPVMGKVINDWNRNHSIPLYGKIAATGMLGISLVFAHWKDTVPTWARACALIFSIMILTFIWTRPTSKSIHLRKFKTK